jgi:hypothetical protein
VMLSRSSFIFLTRERARWLNIRKKKPKNQT